MKTLYLLRHAKSSWDDLSLKDFDRPLNERGKKSAPKMGAYIRKKKIKPDLILSSPAVRARQTTELVCDAAALAVTQRYEAQIYEASARRLFELVSEIEDEVQAAMMVGHNPGFEALLEVLTGESRRMPTAALACIELKIDKWTAVAPGCGTVTWLTKPKDLT